MKFKIILFIIFSLFFIGCVNERGVSIQYYDDCHLRYDFYGNYRTVCPYNFYNEPIKEKKDCLQCN